MYLRCSGLMNNATELLWNDALHYPLLQHQILRCKVNWLVICQKNPVFMWRFAASCLLYCCKLNIWQNKTFELELVKSVRLELYIKIILYVMCLCYVAIGWYPYLIHLNSQTLLKASESTIQYLNLKKSNWSLGTCDWHFHYTFWHFMD